MTYAELLQSARYMYDAKGEKTDVMVPFPIWNKLIGVWERLMDALEEQEDLAIFTEWQQKRAQGLVETMSLDELEQELIADGLLPS